MDDDTLEAYSVTISCQRRPKQKWLYFWQGGDNVTQADLLHRCRGATGEVWCWQEGGGNFQTNASVLLMTNGVRFWAKIALFFNQSYRWMVRLKIHNQYRVTKANRPA